MQMANPLLRRKSPKIRNSNGQWIVFVLASIFIHAAAIFFLKPQYFYFMRKELPAEEDINGRLPYFDNPFQLIPLAFEQDSKETKVLRQESTRQENDSEISDFSIGEPSLELLPIGGKSPGASRGESRTKTVLPKPLYIPWPKYPKGVEETGGSVELAVFVNEKGEVEDVRIIRDLPNQELNRIAEESSRKIRFTPGSENGRLTSMWVRLSISFQPR